MELISSVEDALAIQAVEQEAEKIMREQAKEDAQGDDE